MTTQNETRFELQGRFAGFFRDIFHKRRMVLRVGAEELYLKVPKILRKELERVLVAGQEIAVLGHCASGEREARVVTTVRIAGREGCISCPIRICTKKNCWRNGGREMWQILERKVVETGLSGSVKLKPVDCLDFCKLAPNIECAGHDYHGCTPRDADSILARFVAWRWINRQGRLR